jgi:hypothetical protein
MLKLTVAATVALFSVAVPARAGTAQDVGVGAGDRYS